MPSVPPASSGDILFKSVYTPNFPPLLHNRGISILVSTYQADRLILLRSDGKVLNTHFRNFKKPMGLAADQNRIAIGTAQEIRQFRNFPPICQLLEQPDRHDACYLPRMTHVTGDIDIHEMAWVNDDLWFINTRFSCLCTLDAVNSFVPRWRPPFVRAFAAEDRCHLNGLCVAVDATGNAAVRYATAFATTDTPEGWRAHKKDGGVLIEVPSGDVIADKLSMPHSPRLHNGQIWVLESGRGGLGVVDRASGRYQMVAELPGFTRGLDFHGNLAFVGLSQVRESAVFSDISIASLPPNERSCGVWIVDVNTGRTVSFLRFEGAVQEVFAVQVLSPWRWPELICDDTQLIGKAYELPPSAMSDVQTPNSPG